MHVAALINRALLLPMAGNDSNVEWNGVSHVAWLDRNPQCPIDGESFGVLFQTYWYDITSARVHYRYGTVNTWENWQTVDADWAVNKGTYDVWNGILPATSRERVEYYIEITDGSDTDYLVPPDPFTGEFSGRILEVPPSPAGGWVVDFETLSHAPLGCTFTRDGGAVFRLWAPDTSTVDIAGSFIEWCQIPLVQDGDSWTGYVPHVGAGDEYKYVLNDFTGM